MKHIIGILLAGFVWLTPSISDAQDWRVRSGYNDLVARLGASTPTGAGVLVSMVEAAGPSDNNYLPDPSFPSFAGKTFTSISGPGGISSHATGAAGDYFFGAGPTGRSVAPGVTQIRNFRVDNDPGGSGAIGWAFSASLNFGTTSAPLVEPSRSQSHAWIGSTGNDTFDAEILRRVDLQVRRDNLFVSVGVFLGKDFPAIPPLLASGYNSIAVGVDPIPGGQFLSNRGPTTFPGEPTGRSKPDLVVPGDNIFFSPSNATAAVAGVGAMLIETAQSVTSATTNPALALGNPVPDAQRVETLKAVILTGADKFYVVPAYGWSRTTTQPLDVHSGAGRLNVDLAHAILTAGQFRPSGSSTVNARGWDYNEIAASGTQTYFFDLEAGRSLTATLNWLRVVDFVSGGLTTPVLADLNLRLFNATGFTLGTQIDASLSPVDNVEHLYQVALPAGRYALQVSNASAFPAYYALAWDGVRAVPEPGALGLISVAGCVAGLAWRRRWLASRAKACRESRCLR